MPKREENTDKTSPLQRKFLSLCEEANVLPTETLSKQLNTDTFKGEAIFSAFSGGKSDIKELLWAVTTKTSWNGYYIEVLKEEEAVIFYKN